MNWQELLWTIPTASGWKWYALWGTLAIIGSGIMFAKMILHHEFSALLVGRALYGLGGVLIPLCVLQPGYERWIIVPYALSLFILGALVATGWCERQDKSLKMHTALWRWLRCRVSEGVTWLCGPFRPARREDML